VLITGGKGMLANAFARLFPQRGVAPMLLGRDRLDITNVINVQNVLRDVRPTLVINCAAYTKVDQAEKEFDLARRVNALGPTLLAATCEKQGAMLVHFSTDYVFDGTLRRPLRPDDPVGPQSAYGRSKLCGEQVIAESKTTNWLIVRTAWLYGRGGPNFVQTMVNAGRAGRPLTVVNDQVGSPTYTLDLAQATLELIDRGASGIFHVSNSGQTTWYDFAAAIFEEFGLRPQLSAILSAQWKASRPDSAPRPAYSVLDLSATERLLGRPMRPWRDALRAFKAEVDAHGEF
jgi:dTDP-4-dehydrorhamnose reductase